MSGKGEKTEEWNQYGKLDEYLEWQKSFKCFRQFDHFWEHYYLITVLRKQLGASFPIGKTFKKGKHTSICLVLGSNELDNS